MTTIVMRKLEDRIEVAFDSKVSNGHTFWELKENKVAEVNGMYFGVAGRLRALNAIHHMTLNPPTGIHGDDLTKWVHRVLVPKLRQTIHEAIPDGAWDSQSGVLVVVNNEIYEIDSDFSVTQSVDGVYAIGSGSDFAKSALDFGKSVKESVEYAGEKDIWTGYTIKSLTISI